MAPGQSYEHRVLQLPQSAGPAGLTGAMDAAGAEGGWECFQVLPTTRREPGGGVEAVFHLFLRRPRVRLVLPGDGAACLN